MRELGRHIIVDPGTREQSYYQSFSPNTLHGDNQVLKAQQEIQQHYGDQIVIADLARACFLSERTFLRRFAKATGYKPKEYLQRLRIQKACELFETSDISVEDAATQVGYRDISAFRKTFVKNMGLTPSEFTHRFAGEHNMRQAV
jgi:transcriptional regulator GlxA family with amidase domain